MGSRQNRENWERFCRDWEAKKLIVQVDPMKALQAVKEGIAATYAPVLWGLGLACVPVSLALGFFVAWWIIPIGFVLFLVLHFASQRLFAKALIRAMCASEQAYNRAVGEHWVLITRIPGEEP